MNLHFYDDINYLNYVKINATSLPVERNRTKFKKRERVINTTFTLTPTHKEKLTKRAKEEDISASRLVRDLIDDYC
ncbi:hypothetical protein PML89_09625 (plasmid) [Vagococcus lutrae]|uniref:hypothetical protein n=1 Tax=Vagococcus lutrae TaxID=81947 RepID=UPI00232AF603|nr:hypothetical protein [Vagococcus lutrae]WCG06117.1 hypothetical protein PML89_09625 [Vagococcus lutrae]